MYPTFLPYTLVGISIAILLDVPASPCRPRWLMREPEQMRRGVADRRIGVYRSIIDLLSIVPRRANTHLAADTTSHQCSGHVQQQAMFVVVEGFCCGEKENMFLIRTVRLPCLPSKSKKYLTAFLNLVDLFWYGRPICCYMVLSKLFSEILGQNIEDIVRKHLQLTN